MSYPFDPQQGLIIVGAELWGPSGSALLRLALDTGATATVVNVGMEKETVCLCMILQAV